LCTAHPFSARHHFEALPPRENQTHALNCDKCHVPGGLTDWPAHGLCRSKHACWSTVRLTAALVISVNGWLDSPRGSIAVATGPSRSCPTYHPLLFP
jgi:hypothetical protein